MNQSFGFKSAEITSKITCILERDFLEELQIDKNHKIVLNCDFSIPLLYDC